MTSMNPSEKAAGATGPDHLADLPTYPMPRDGRCPFDPAPGLRQLQAQTPVARGRQWDGDAWLVTGYADQRKLRVDKRISANNTLPGYPHKSAGKRAHRTSELGQSFIGIDDPEHGRLRRMVMSPFTSKNVESLRPAIQRIVDEAVDGLLAGPNPTDLIEGFSLPIPSLAICEILGVPYADHAFFEEQSRVLVDQTAAPGQLSAAMDALVDYLDRLITAKQEAPTAGLLSELANGRLKDGELTRGELIGMALLLLEGGHGTTTHMISLGVVALLQHPDQLKLLREADDPADVARAVEELLRFLNITHSGRRRVALADIEIDGARIKAGEGLIMPNEVANRDETVFPDPDRLDLHRDARRHLAFGFGPHQCLGQNLARVELQIGYSTLFRRVPTLRLAVDFEDLVFNEQSFVYGVTELPVTW
jgi:cytochrome P450